MEEATIDQEERDQIQREASEAWQTLVHLSREPVPEDSNVNQQIVDTHWKEFLLRFMNVYELGLKMGGKIALKMFNESMAEKFGAKPQDIPEEAPE
jgi:hypothetical protein